MNPEAHTRLNSWFNAFPRAAGATAIAEGGCWKRHARHREHHMKLKRAEMEGEIARRQAELDATEIELKSVKLEESAVEQGRVARAKMRGEETSDAQVNTGARKGKQTGARRKGVWNEAI